jgi:ABC-type antimicrobial peptide transport system permease subunit
MVRFGPSALLHLPVLAALGSLALALAVGLMLSLIGIVYPALVAARMQPVEAMRAEN